ncbi:hypothetical protein D3C81_1938080 [compost metagenome]
MQDNIMPIAGVELADLYAGFTPGMDEFPAANINPDMAWYSVTVKTAGHREENQVTGLKIIAAYPPADVVLISSQPRQSDAEFLKYMPCIRGAVKFFGFLIRTGTEIIRHT